MFLGLNPDSILPINYFKSKNDHSELLVFVLYLARMSTFNLGQLPWKTLSRPL